MNQHNITYDEVREEISKLTGDLKVYYNLILEIAELYKEVKDPGGIMTCDVLIIKYALLMKEHISHKLWLYLSFCNPNLCARETHLC